MKKIHITIIIAVLLISVTIGCTYKSKLIIPEKNYINTETSTQPNTNMSTISLSTDTEEIASSSVPTKSTATSTEEPTEEPTKESTKKPTQKPQPTTAKKPVQKPTQKPTPKPTPTTQKPVQKPTPTKPIPTTPPVTTKYATVIADGVSYKRPVGSTIEYVVEVDAGRLFEDIQAKLTYQSAKLELVRYKSNDPDISDWEIEGEICCPNLDGIIFNANTSGTVKFNASKISGYNFKGGKVLLRLEFIVKTEGTSTIDLAIEEMTIKDGYESYFTGGHAVITNGITVTEKIK